MNLTYEQMLTALVDARNLILRRGWRRGPKTQDTENLCLLEAVSRATFDYTSHGWWGEAHADVKRVLTDTLPGMGTHERTYTGDTLIRFNDAPSRTQGDVIKLIDDTISRLRREHDQAPAEV